MSVKKTIVWLLIAGALFGLTILHRRHPPAPPAGPIRVLPGLTPATVSSIQIRPAGPTELLIRADHTNGVWQLTQPVTYAAQPRRVLKLLTFLEQLTAAPYITGSELRGHSNADEEYGFAAPQATVMLQQGQYVPRLRVGNLTAPGDQVFLQVEGDLGAYVVDAELLKYLPRSANDWRDTTLLELTNIAFNRLSVTNNSRGDPSRSGLPASSSTFVLQRPSGAGLWRMIWPLDARANHPKIERGLKKLQDIQIRQFVSDDPQIDLEPFGLAPPELELGFADGTNSLALLQFGRGVTNDVTRIYARRPGLPGVFAVDKDLLLDWCSFLNDFRDPHLLSLTDVVDSIEFVHGPERSSVHRQSDGGWRISPGDFIGDRDSAQGFFVSLTNLEITKFVNDVANPADLPQYGLAAPFERLILTSRCASSASDSIATTVAELEFGVGTNSAGQVFARRTDESFVYAIATNDFARLPFAGWQLRDRRLCRFALSDITGLTLRGHGQTSQMIHKGPLSWSFAPGSQGIINDAAIEETIRGVIQCSAIAWAGRGEQSRAAFGFKEDGYHLILNLKSGEKFELELGGEAPGGNVYAGLMSDGEFWILEFPWIMFRDIDAYLPLRPSR